MSGNLDYRGNNFAGITPCIAYIENAGVQNFVGDYTGGGDITPTFAPGVLSVFAASALQILLAWDDGAATAIDWQKYGNLVALGAGLDPSVIRSGVESKLLYGGGLIKNNGQFVNPIVTITVLRTSLLITMPFPEVIELNGSAGDTFNIPLSDNFTGLVTQRFTLLGATGYISE